MNHSTALHTQKVSLSDLNVLAFQLREAGAKFRSTIHKQEAIIVFSTLPTPALSILETIGKNQEANRDEESLLAGEGSQSIQEKGLQLDNEQTIDAFATEKQLLKLSKTKLKKLAHQYKIEGRSKLDHEQLVSALANLVPLKNLSGIKNTTHYQIPKD